MNTHPENLDTDVFWLDDWLVGFGGVFFFPD